MKKNKKASAAILGVIILILLYLTTLVTAFLNIPNWDKLFQASLVATIGVPILLWIYVLIYKKWQERNDD
ncbi:MAG: hypothetical protein J6C33_06210 [Lachnospiraceae bacterium]|nr:hypothetical protein [Lachnospiraceae bacterium]